MSHPSVLVVHGALGSASQMQPVVDALMASGRFDTVRAVELPGHGRTPLAEGMRFGMDTFADAVAEAAAKVRAETGRAPIVFGYSMGGYAAMLLASRASDAIGALVTLGTMVRWTPEIAAQAAARLDPVVIAVKVPAFADVLAARHLDAGGWELMMQRTATLLRELGDAPPLTTSAFGAIRCPVHLMVGEKDDSVTLADCEAVATQMVAARASRLPGIPHPIERVPMEMIVEKIVRPYRHDLS